MQKITRTELTWLIKELDHSTANARNLATATTGSAKALLTLRADNLAALAEKLTKTATDNDKRIEVVQ